MIDDIPGSIDFLIDQDNLFREEVITDLKIATIRKMIPIKPDGTDDPDRQTVFVGATQIGTPHGPVPIQALLEAETLAQAMAEFPNAMARETKKVADNFRQMEKARKKQQDSRIILPGIQ